MTRILVPKSDFVSRKVWAWVLLGPANPVFWVLTFPFQGHFNPFSMLGFFTIFPCALGIGLVLLRTKSQDIEQGKLFGRTIAWAFATIFWYALAVTALMFAPQAFSGGSVATLAGALLYVMPFAYILGCIPAIVFALISAAVLERMLFERDRRAQAF
jgi:predicted outer membrane lipoprotein